MKRRLIAIAAAVAMLLCLGQLPAHAAVRGTSFEEALAEDLKALGLFKGVSDTDFDLGRAPSRAEALVMLIRVLGKENEALGGNWTHPFTDVASWANKYVGYAYQNDLTNGVSATQFGAGTANATMYLTFVLRALGYSDAGGADFAWNDPFSLAESVGILPECVNTSAFLRADVVLVSYCALQAALKGSAQTLAQKLIAAGVFTQAQFDAHYDAGAVGDYIGSAAISSDPGLTAEEIYAKCSPAVFYIEAYDSGKKLIAAGSGFFIDKSGTAVTSCSVVAGCASAKITVDSGKTYDVLGFCDYNVIEDWTVIKIGGTDFAYLEAGDPSTVIGGSTVYAIGSPLGLQNTISHGIISNVSRVENGISYIQTSAALSAGSGGGALINKYGEVIGITIGTLGQNLNLALPMTRVKPDSLTSYKPLGMLVPDPIAYLIEYLEKHGTYAYTMAGPSYRIRLVSGDKEYSVCYGTDRKMLFIYYFDPIYASAIYLQGAGSEFPDSYMYIFYFDEDDGSTTVAGGYLDAPAFDSETSLLFASYNGSALRMSAYQEIVKDRTLETLFAAQQMFEENGMYITIEDLGFSAAYAEYGER